MRATSVKTAPALRADCQGLDTAHSTERTLHKRRLFSFQRGWESWRVALNKCYLLLFSFPEQSILEKRQCVFPFACRVGRREGREGGVPSRGGQVPLGESQVDQWAEAQDVWKQRSSRGSAFRGAGSSMPRGGVKTWQPAPVKERTQGADVARSEGVLMRVSAD